MTCSDTPPSTPPSVIHRRAQAVREQQQAPGTNVPTQQALSAMLKQEAAAELVLVRRGEEAAVARINQLKAMNANHERTIALLTQSLSAQSELIHDCHARVASLASALPSPQQLQQQQHQHQQQQHQQHASSQRLPQWEAVYSAVQTLYQRLQRGTASRPGSAKASPRLAGGGAARPPPAHGKPTSSSGRAAGAMPVF
jgi:response regulator RpfG family c-di-GMP phosphodiesterase